MQPQLDHLQTALKAPGMRGQGEQGPGDMEPYCTKCQEAGPLHTRYEETGPREGMRWADAVNPGPTGTQTPSSQLPILPTAQALQQLCPQSASAQVCQEAENRVKQPQCLWQQSGQDVEFSRLWSHRDLKADPSFASDLLCGLGQVTSLSEPRYSPL